MAIYEALHVIQCFQVSSEIVKTTNLMWLWQTLFYKSNNRQNIVKKRKHSNITITTHVYVEKCILGKIDSTQQYKTNIINMISETMHTHYLTHAD